MVWSSLKEGIRDARYTVGQSHGRQDILRVRPGTYNGQLFHTQTCRFTGYVQRKQKPFIHVNVERSEIRKLFTPQLGIWQSMQRES